jgi:hypothetical protein
VPHITPLVYITMTSKILWWTYVEELVDLTSMFVMIILMLTEWPARSPVFRPFWRAFWGVEKRLKNDEKSTSWRKSDVATRAKKLFYIMQHKNFLVHAQQIQQNSARAKKHQKMTIFDPFSETPKNSHF